MKLLIHTIFLGFLLTNAFGQSMSLRDQLWQRVQECHSKFRDLNDDGEVDYEELIDDSRSGYLKISGTWPTCGCGCTNVIGAYRSTNGNYVFLEKEQWICSWKHKISSNVKLDAIFPDFTEVFFSGQINDTSSYASFYIDIEIPRRGTQTNVSLKVIPFGLQVKSEGVLSYGYVQKKFYSNCNEIDGIKEIAKDIQNPRTLHFILNDQFDKIAEPDMEVIKKVIRDDKKSKDYLINNIRKLKRTYDLYSMVEYKSLVLDWNRKRERFYIKEKKDLLDPGNFREFLTKNKYWGVRC